MEWKRSSFCNADKLTGNCVEVAEADGGIWVRRKVKYQRASRPEFFTMDEWRAFTEGVKAGEFDF